MQELSTRTREIIVPDAGGGLAEGGEVGDQLRVRPAVHHSGQEEVGGEGPAKLTLPGRHPPPPGQSGHR